MLGIPGFKRYKRTDVVSLYHAWDIGLKMTQYTKLNKIFIPANIARRRVCRRGRIWIKKPSWKSSRSLGNIHPGPQYNFKTTITIAKPPEGTEILSKPYPFRLISAIESIIRYQAWEFGPSLKI